MRGTSDVKGTLPNRTEQRRGTKDPSKTDQPEQQELIPEDIPEDMLEESEQRIDSSIPCKFDQIVYRDNVKGKTLQFQDI